MARIGSIISLLAQTDLFKGLDGPHLATCAAAFHQASFAKGETLFVRGDVGSRLYLIAEGRVRLAIVTDEGARAELSPCDFGRSRRRDRSSRWGPTQR